MTPVEWKLEDDDCSVRITDDYSCVVISDGEDRVQINALEAGDLAKVMLAVLASLGLEMPDLSDFGYSLNAKPGETP